MKNMPDHDLRQRVEQLDSELARSREEAASLHSILDAFIEGSQQVLKHRGFAETARSLFDLCKKQIGAQCGYVALLNEEGSENEVLFLDAGGLPCGVNPELPMPIRGLRGEVYARGETAYENDFEKSEWMKFMPQGHVRMKNVMFAPLIHDGKTVGILGLANKPTDFDAKDARIATTFGKLAAIALREAKRIDDIQMAEEALRQSESKFRTLFDTMDEGVCLHEIIYGGDGKPADYRILDVNPAYERITEIARDAALNRTASELYSTGEPPFLNVYARVAETGEADAFEIFWPPMKRHFLISIVSPQKGQFATVFTDITAQKEKEERLRVSEEYLATTLNSIGDAVIVTDLHGKVVGMNPVAEKLTGWKLSEASGTPLEKVFTILNQKTREKVENPASKVLREGGIVGLANHTVLISKEGKEYFIDDSGGPIKGDDGKVVGVVLIFRDVTEKYMAEETLRHERDLMARMMETSPAGIVRVDARGVVNYANTLAEQILGIALSENSERTYDDPAWIITDFEGGPFPEEKLPFTTVKQTGKPVFGIQHAIQWPDGKHVLLSVNAAPLVGDAGAFDGMVATIEDITEKYLAEQNYQTLFREMIDGFALHEIICDDLGHPINYRILAVNPAFERLTGLRGESLIGKTILDVLPSIESCWIETCGQVALTGQPACFESYAQDSDRHFQVTAFRPAKNQFACMLVDITERKRAEEERAITLDLLRLLNQHNGIRELMADVTLLMRNWSGCDAVAIRLREGEDFPYFETRGFPPEFIRSENRLCAVDNKGQPVRDGAGNPVLECMCGNVLCGRFDPRLPFFTDSGSFWTNSTTELLAATDEKDRQARTRNRCHGEGYESVALVPLRRGSQILGLLQFNDSRRGRFDRAKVALLERLASNLAIGITERKAAQSLLESRERFQQLFDNMSDGVAVYLAVEEGKDFVFVDLNKTGQSLSHVHLDEAIGQRITEVFPAAERMGLLDVLRRVWQTGQPEDLPITQYSDGRISEWVENHVYKLPSGLVVALYSDTTEKRKAEEALQKSEEKYRLITENAGEAIVVAQDGMIKFANQMTSRLTGFPLPEITSRPYITFIHPDDRDKVSGNQQARIRGEQVPSFYEFRLINSEDSVRWVEVNAVVTEWDGRAATLNLLTDITERKRSEEKINSQARTLNVIFNSAPNILLLVNDEGRVEKINHKGAAFSGRKENELLGLLGGEVFNCISSFDGEGCGRNPVCSHCPVRTRVESTLQTGVPRSEEEGRMTFLIDGKETTLHLLISTVPVELDGSNKILILLTDITKLKQAEDALAESEKRYRTFFEQAPYGAVVLDQKTARITEFNDQACRQLGYSREEFARLRVSDIELEESAEEIQTHIQEVLKEGYDEFETLQRNKQGEIRHVHVHAQVTEINNHPVYRCIWRDITKELELENRVTQAQKMEAIGTLAGGIAHDFNNILGAVTGYTEMALFHIAPDSPERGYLEQVLRGGERAKDLVKQILAFSRQSDEEKKPVHMGIILKEALKFLRATLPTTITIESAIDRDSGVVLADPVQIHQIIMNLCSNAGYAMRLNGGLLRIDLRDVQLDADEVKRLDLEPLTGAYSRLSVSDTGTGIPPAVLNRVFDPFFTTKGKGEGTGLGLSVVHGIVKHSGGAITVETQPGEGATFKIYLPRLATVEQEKPAPREPLERGSGVVLLVDDEETLAQLGRHMLQRLGYEAVCSTTGKEALALFSSEPERFDLIVTDLTMPGVTGIDLAKAILAIRPDIPVILCTGYSDELTEQRAREAGIREIVTKPINFRDFGVVIQKMLS